MRTLPVIAPVGSASASTRARTRAGSLLFIVAASASTAWAASPAPRTSCEPEAQALQATTAQQLQQALPAELGKLANCQYDSQWLGWVGWSLNQVARYGEAAEYLERSLMLRPDALHVQLDYAIALAGSGDGLASIQLMQSLLQQPHLPPLLRTTLLHEIARWSGRPQGWQHRWQIANRIGYDSNLLGTPDISTLTITSQGQNIPLPLDASYRRQPGNYARTDLSWSAYQGPWQLSASVGARASSRQGAGLGQGQATAEYQAPRYYVGASLAALNTSAGTRYRAAGLAAGLQGIAANCSTRAGAELQKRWLQNNTVLSGHYTGLLLQHTCEADTGQPWPWGLQVWQASLRWGQDHPHYSLRPGGLQNQTAARLLALGRGWAAQHQWLVDAEAFQQADTNGYSPLLSNGARRRIARVALRAEYSWPLRLQPDSTWQLALGMEWQRQRANMALFQQRSQGAYVVLRSQW